jgi:hypothetical protein
MIKKLDSSRDGRGRCGEIGMPDTITRLHHEFRATAVAAAAAVHRCWLD